jgi:hypothetical protein
VGSSQIWDEEPVDAIFHSPRQDFAELPWISIVCSSQGIEVLTALALTDDRGRIPVAHKKKVQH